MAAKVVSSRKSEDTMAEDTGWLLHNRGELGAEKACPKPRTSGKFEVMRQGWGKPGIQASNSELGSGPVRITSDHQTGP